MKQAEGPCVNFTMAHADIEYRGDFFMIGVIHRDERNPDILSTLLEKIQPDVITVEVSRYSLEFRRSTGDMYRERLGGICGCLDRPHGRTISGLYSFIDMPSEFTVAEEYCRQHDTAVYPVDMDLFSLLKLRRVDELIDRGNVAANLCADEKARTSEKVLADLYFRKGVTAFSYDEEMVIRDSFICHKIGILKKRYANRRFVHIAGWQHLRDPLSLYEPFHPVKIFPYD